MKKLGLIGKVLDYSFSKNYFQSKFSKEGIVGFEYELYPIPEISHFVNLIGSYPELIGLNVTIPYKRKVIKFLDDWSKEASEIGAVNTIKFVDGKLIGYNTDVYGFEISLLKFLNNSKVKALVLGTGGASRAIKFVLKKNKIPFLTVSRTKNKGDLTYEQITPEIILDYKLIINTTPLGTTPNVKECPLIPYNLLSKNYFLYDLVYNPEKSLFLQRGEQNGVNIKNGLEMLELQAEKAWEIWKN